MSTNRGRDLIGVQNLLRKHQGLIGELQSHEAQIRTVCNEGEDMINQGRIILEIVVRKFLLFYIK
jgi:hypothetical protein